jgi:pimeloyl-ACP methyl ester carboxylesterase
MPIAADLHYSAYEGGVIDSIPVVLIHGAGGNHLYWPTEARRLPGYRVYALDLPGHGKSAGCGQQTISAYVAAVLSWLEAMGQYRAVFVGHSMGAAIALMLAIQSPERTSGLGLVGAGARLRVNPMLLEYTANPTTFYKAVEMVTAWSFGPSADARLVELALRRMREARPSVLHGDLLACAGFDVTEQIGDVCQPTLVICGADDRMTPTRDAQFLAGMIPGAQIEIIPNAGHMVMLEQPQAVAAALAAFLPGCEPRWVG